MSLALVQESAREVRRLAIAGSPLAIGDFRLKKLIAPLEQAGAKVPVFAQVAKSISDLVHGKEADSAANLLNLSTLLNAILYTQGQTGVAAAFEELPSYVARVGAGGGPSTRTTARVLKPIVEALTSAGAGRFEVVKSAVERGAFQDLRLIEPALQALNDNYAEMADLVAEKILPGYGPGIGPLVKQGLDLKGKKSDARRLLVLHQLDPSGAVELAKSALDDGSAEVKEAAITCLGKHEDCLPLVFEQTKAKNKTLRAAALEALAEHDRPETTQLFTELLAGKSLELLARPFRSIRNAQVLGALLAEGRRVFDLLVKGDENNLQRYSEILACLDHRKEPPVEQFLLDCFAQSEKLSKVKAPKNFTFAGADLTISLTTILYRIASPKAFDAILAKRDSLPSAGFYIVLRSALRTWTPARVYDEFSPLFGQKKGAAKEKAEQLQQTIWTTSEGIGGAYYFGGLAITEEDTAALAKLAWDPRWLDLAIKHDDLETVTCLARPGHSGVVQYLLKRSESKSLAASADVIEALAQCGYPKVTDVFLGLVTRKTKSAKHVDYEIQYLFRSVVHLPVADLPKLDAFAATLDEKFVDDFLEALGPLRTTPPPTP